MAELGGVPGEAAGSRQAQRRNTMCPHTATCVLILLILLILAGEVKQLGAGKRNEEIGNTLIILYCVLIYYLYNTQIHTTHTHTHTQVKQLGTGERNAEIGNADVC